MSVMSYNSHLIGPANGLYYFNSSPVPAPIYSGFTYETTGEYGETLDPAPGTLKNLTATYIQISGGNWSGVYTLNPVPGGLSDGLGIYAPSAGTYSLIWNNWNNYSNKNLGNRREHNIRGTMTKVLSLDFWGKTDVANMRDLFYYNSKIEPITDLPQTSSNIHNGESLTSCTGLFGGVSSITGNLIPFITAMQAACPNLKYAYYCLTGATNAADYNEAKAQYPAWFY